MRPPESFIGQPVRSLQTMLRVIAENDNDYRSVIPDGIYGSQTAEAVSVFQRKHGLSVTGSTDQQTWEAIVSKYEEALVNVSPAEPLHIILDPGEVIYRNQSHPNLFPVQGMLAVYALAYASIPSPEMTGILDIPTSQAISAFQQLNGLPVSGELDKHTWRHLALQYPSAAAAAQRNITGKNREKPGIPLDYLEE